MKVNEVVFVFFFVFFFFLVLVLVFVILLMLDVGRSSDICHARTNDLT